MTLLKRTFITFLLGGILASGFSFIPLRQAQAVTYEQIMSRGIIFAGIGDDCRDDGDCTLEDILQVFVNIATFILGISGSIVLLMFIYGGFIWLTSGGNENQVKKGKDILVGTTIGLIIIFGAYTAMTVLISVLKTGELPESGENLEDVLDTDIIETTETETTTEE